MFYRLPVYLLLFACCFVYSACVDVSPAFAIFEEGNWPPDPTAGGEDPCKEDPCLCNPDKCSPHPTTGGRDTDGDTDGDSDGDSDGGGGTTSGGGGSDNDTRNDAVYDLDDAELDCSNAPDLEVCGHRVAGKGADRRTFSSACEAVNKKNYVVVSEGPCEDNTGGGASGY